MNAAGRVTWKILEVAPSQDNACLPELQELQVCVSKLGRS